MSAKRTLTAVGVHHIFNKITEPDLDAWDSETIFEPTSNLPSFQLYVKYLKNRNVRKIGAEHVTPKTLSEIDKVDDFNQYWKRVQVHSEENGIAVHHAEGEPSSNFLSKFHYVLGKALNCNNLLMLNQRFEDHDSFFSAKEKNAIRKVINKVVEKVSITPEKLTELFLALHVERSIQMHNFAKRKDLTHIVMGINHAEDLRGLGLANVKYIGDSEKENLRNIRYRIKQYELHKELIGEIKEIVRKEI